MHNVAMTQIQEKITRQCADNIAEAAMLVETNRSAARE